MNENELKTHLRILISIAIFAHALAACAPASASVEVRKSPTPLPLIPTETPIPTQTPEPPPTPDNKTCSLDSIPGIVPPNNIGLTEVGKVQLDEIARQALCNLGLIATTGPEGVVGYFLDTPSGPIFVSTTPVNDTYMLANPGEIAGTGEAIYTNGSRSPARDYLVVMNEKTGEICHIPVPRKADVSQTALSNYLSKDPRDLVIKCELFVENK